jgi:uncharacterized protein (TIGR04222 family)
MTQTQVELWRRIQGFSFDEDAAAYTFAQRLAKENGWSAPFTQRAIEEYRRFAFLAVTAGHPVSPSDAVDQVWHLHLLYTRSYWRQFCGEALGRELHHEPSVGGAGERAKFEDWYEKTLASYRRFFGEPPRDLWPDALAKAAAGERFQRVDLSKHLLLTRRDWRKIARAVAAAIVVVMLLMFATGCDDAIHREWNPLEFRGPKFLLFYAAAFLAACVWGIMVRADARDPSDADAAPLKLDAYDMAYLNGGAKLLVNTAIAALSQRGLVAARYDRTLRGPTPGEAPAVGLHSIERALHREVTRGGTLAIEAAHERFGPMAEEIGRRLKNAGLLVSDAVNGRARRRSLPLVLAVPALGVVKVFVGLERNRPVAFLVAACLMSLIIGLAAFGRRLHRTRRGESALDYLRTKYGAMRKQGPSAASAVSISVALWGVGTLVGAEYATLRAVLAPPGSRASGSSWSSSCASGCGGGGGCAGGGCGGGCGGCGS